MTASERIDCQLRVDSSGSVHGHERPLTVLWSLGRRRPNSAFGQEPSLAGGIKIPLWA